MKPADHLDALIRIPSVSALSNRPLLDYAAAALHSAGWSTQRFPCPDPANPDKANLLAAPPGQPIDAHAVDLVCVCHTDTVPFAPSWTGALVPRLLDGVLHGCGACDVKGFLACLLAFADAPPPASFPSGLRFLFTADEEIGCRGAAHFLAHYPLRPRRVLVGEPTSLHPARAGKGYCLARITVHGREAHSAHPAQGISAITHAARLLLALDALAADLARTTNPFFDPPSTTLNIGTIEGGTAKNIVPGRCQFQLEWRPLPSDPADRVLDAVRACADRLHLADPGFSCDIDPLRRQPGFETPADAQLVRALEAASGRPAVAIPFGSEASLFAPIAEETVVFGPGDMRTAHSPRECVPLADLDEAVAILRAVTAM